MTTTFPATFHTTYAGHADEAIVVEDRDGVLFATFADGAVEPVIAANVFPMRHNADGSLVCMHRDLSVCPACAAHPAIVDVVGAHYFDPTGALTAEVVAIAAAVVEPALHIIDVVDDLTGATIPAVEECHLCHAGPFAGEDVPTALDVFDAHVARCAR